MKHISRRSTGLTALLTVSAITAVATLPGNQTGAAPASHSSANTAPHTTSIITHQTTTTPAPDISTDAQNTATAPAASVSVTVNGQDISVPDNGSVSKTITTEDGNGQTDVTVNRSTTSTGTSTNFSSSTTSSNVYSSTNSSSTGFQQESHTP